MTQPRTINLRDLFLARQQELAVKLRGNRAVLPHPGTKGDASEANWLALFRDYLPGRYQVEQASVVDADGQLSDAMDVVIFDNQYCPLLFRRDGAVYVPAESVYAVFEVKQSLSRGHVQYAGDKAASVRRLRRTSVPIRHAGGQYAPKPPARIMAGLLTLESDWTPALDEPLLTALCERPEEARLDLGCALEHGAFEMTYPEDGAPRWEHVGADTALIFFLMRLLERLQQVGTVAAIDLRDYGKDL